MRTNLFGIIALGMGLLTQKQLTYALEVQRREDTLNMPHRRLGSVCSDLGYMTCEQVTVVMERIRVLGLPLIFGQRPVQPLAEFDLAEMSMDSLPKSLDGSLLVEEGLTSSLLLKIEEETDSSNSEEIAGGEITEEITIPLYPASLSEKTETMTPEVIWHNERAEETFSVAFNMEEVIASVDDDAHTVDDDTHTVDRIAAHFPSPRPHETHVAADLFRALLSRHRSASLQILELQARVKEGKNRADVLCLRLESSEREVRDLRRRLDAYETVHLEKV